MTRMWCLDYTITCILLYFFFYSSVDHRDLHSFPTRRSSDLKAWLERATGGALVHGSKQQELAKQFYEYVTTPVALDRKSTRLNSSHVRISYAVFCLKKKKTHHIHSHSKDQL